jgi:hypothetical protein
MKRKTKMKRICKITTSREPDMKGLNSATAVEKYEKKELIYCCTSSIGQDKKLNL